MADGEYRGVPGQTHCVNPGIYGPEIPITSWFHLQSQINIAIPIYFEGLSR